MRQSMFRRRLLFTKQLARTLRAVKFLPHCHHRSTISQSLSTLTEQIGKLARWPELINDGQQLAKLKQLSQHIVQRSGSRDIVQKQFDLAKTLCQTYYESHPAQRFQYLIFLAEDFSTNFDAATQASNSFLNIQKRAEPYDVALLVDRLRQQIRPNYMELFRCIARLNDGVKFLVDVRGDLLTVLMNQQLLSEQKPHCKVYLRLLSTQLSDLLSLWFSAGFLRLERATWDSPSSILQKISEYEAVHPIRNWLDLKHRVGLYRRCYMFSHSCLPGEPLVILHVALVPTISNSIQEIIRKTSHQVTFHPSSSSSTEHHHESSDQAELLNPALFSTHNHQPVIEDPNLIDAAVFYSISSTQKGLNGIDLGNQLIKQVASVLKAEFPTMSQFSSLSPIPNFTEYLLSSIQAIQRGEASEENFLRIWAEHCDLQRMREIVGFETDSDCDDTFWTNLRQILRSGEWISDPILVEQLRQPLMRICAHYLFREKRRGFALNSVANFHLKNGAVMWRLNWLADVSTRGLSNSCGMMVNYRYYLEKYQENSLVYLNEKRIIAGDRFLKWI